MEADEFNSIHVFHLIHYSRVNQYHVVIQISFMSTLSLSLQCSSRERREIAELQCLVISVRDDKEGAEAMIHCSYFNQ